MGLEGLDSFPLSSGPWDVPAALRSSVSAPLAVTGNEAPLRWNPNLLAIQVYQEGKDREQRGKKNQGYSWGYSK